MFMDLFSKNNTIDKTKSKIKYNAKNLLMV